MQRNLNAKCGPGRNRTDSGTGRNPPAAPCRPRAALNNANGHSINSGAKLGRFAMPSSRKAATVRNEKAPDDVFVRTVKKMLATPPKVHDEMKVGAARKCNAPVSKKGSKG